MQLTGVKLTVKSTKLLVIFMLIRRLSARSGESRENPTGDATCSLPVRWFADFAPRRGARRHLPGAFI